ncbi:acyltransferase family protein [Paenibacillus harenae]|uniref:Peptidoglycan/LPS O-acetylase OafA/YrhL n=1 Tax=Paenibacillus harenae TaxID=306543 RepID=A0ABT9U628_PAEHA|nr:acyltransferase [Paenibacillus harenae]MDQ0114702.1 peptidoglycan/LPS O-acetylase OafA/YrhL [Paenibacillus harenae]
MQQRYDQLDSLRGLAALAVMIGHFFLVFMPMAQNTSSMGFLEYPLNVLKYSPLHAFWGGHEAVIMFFLLSGFVLSLPFYSNKQQSYVKYVVKRICRIYLPFVAALLIAILFREAVFMHKLTDLTPYFNSLWTRSPDFASIGDHLRFITNYNTTKYNPIIWTLVHEMRISLLFPFAMILVAKWGWKAGVPLAIGLSLLSSYLLGVIETRYTTNYVISLHYASFFVVGALLAQYRENLKQLYSRFNGWLIAVLMIAALFSYSYKWVIYGKSFAKHITELRGDWLIAIGASVFIVAAMSSARALKLLHQKPLLFLGKISYSLYLYHMIILLTLLHRLNGTMDTAFIAIIAFVVSFGAAAASYYYVELPSIRLGRLLTSSRKPKQTPLSAKGKTSASM